MDFKKEWFVPELGGTVVFQRTDYRCVKCFAAGRDAEVLSFGMKSPSDAEDASAVFNWCSCGHKWIEG